MFLIHFYRYMHYLGALKNKAEINKWRMLEYSAFSFAASIIAAKYFCHFMISYKDFNILSILLKVGTVIA